MSQQDTRQVLISELDALEALARSTMEHLRQTLSGPERDRALSEASAMTLTSAPASADRAPARSVMSLRMASSLSWLV